MTSFAIRVYFIGCTLGQILGGSLLELHQFHPHELNRVSPLARFQAAWIKRHCCPAKVSGNVTAFR